MRAFAILSIIVATLGAGCSRRASSAVADGGGIPDGFDPDAFTGVDNFYEWGCATAAAEASRVPVYMLFVLDGSGSMDLDNKWTAVVPALHAIFDELKTRADASFGVGLTVFADMNDATIGEFSAGPYSSMDVQIGFVDATKHAQLTARLDDTVPYLGTPTFEVLSGQFPLLEQFTPTAPLLPGGKKVLVLMTDGVPDPDMPAGVNEVPWSLQLVLEKSTQSIPIQTFAVGIGNIAPADPMIYDPLFMGQVATNGGVARQPCSPTEATNESNMCHFQITPGGKSPAALQQEFIDTINEIRRLSLSCEYPLETPFGAQYVDPGSVNVVYTTGGGAQSLLQQSATDGWSYDDPSAPTKVVLNGATCETVKADVGGKINIVLGCKTVLR